MFWRSVYCIGGWMEFSSLTSARQIDPHITTCNVIKSICRYVGWSAALLLWVRSRARHSSWMPRNFDVTTIFEICFSPRDICDIKNERLESRRGFWYRNVQWAGCCGAKKKAICLHLRGIFLIFARWRTDCFANWCVCG